MSSNMVSFDILKRKAYFLNTLVQILVANIYWKLNKCGCCKEWKCIVYWLNPRDKYWGKYKVFYETRWGSRIDKRPSTDKLGHKKHHMWHMTCDMWAICSFTNFILFKQQKIIGIFIFKKKIIESCIII